MLGCYAISPDAAKSYGNMVLYRMCEEEPLHQNSDIRGRDTIAGKTWLIGRAHAASPQRGAGDADPNSEQDFFLKLADSLAWPQLDERLKKFTTKNTFSASVLEPILRTHELLVQLVCDVLQHWGTEPKENPRRHTSFASKYLHFDQITFRSTTAW